MTDRPASLRGAIIALLVLSLLLLAPAYATVTAQGTASPEASPAPSAGGQFIAQFDAAAGELSEGVTVDAADTVYASLSPLGQLVRIGSDGAYEVVGTVEGLQEGDIGMLGLAAHADGSIYATIVSANPDAHGVWRFDVDTGEAKRVPGTEQIGLPNGIAFAADGTERLYVANFSIALAPLVPPGGAGPGIVMIPLGA
jgi:hypothetical protein